VTDGLVDTSVFIANETGRPMRTRDLPDHISVSVITVGELRVGLLAANDPGVRGQRLATLAYALSLDPVPVDDGVAEAWAMLRIALRESGQRMPVNDSWIAATAMSLGVPVVTQDDDYLEIRGLSVIHV
jgi:predicted nucleic acid-binding protein